MPRACPALATRVLVDHTSTRPGLSTRSLVVTGMKNGKRPFQHASRFPIVMEARGIEPRSELRSDATPTCVGDALLGLPAQAPRRPKQRQASTSSYAIS